MNNNQLPTIIALLIALGIKMQKGLILLAQALGITQVSAADMESLTDALIEADRKFNVARSALQTANNTFTAADTALTAWLVKARAVLTTFFGSRWSTQWAQAGFINASTAVAGSTDDRMALALRIAAFLTANPGYEAPNLGVTAADGTAARLSVISGQEGVQAAEVALKAQSDPRDAAQATLTTKMRLLINVLGGILDANDPRWLNFGLNIPGSLVTPGQVVGLQVVPNPAETAAADNKASLASSNDLGTGSIQVSCPAVPRATRYRWRMRVVGFDGPFQLVASTVEPLAIISGIPLGATVEVIVQAVNGDRQGVASESVIYQQAAASPAAADKAPAKPAAPAVVPKNGNGSGHSHRNGNGTNGSRRSHRIGNGDGRAPGAKPAR